MDINQFEESILSSQTLPDELIGGVIGGALAVGMSSVDAYKKIQEGGLELYDAPRYVFVESGDKIIRCALIGVCASSGSTILVAGSFAYSIYKAMPLIKNAYGGVVKLLSHPATRKIALNTCILTISLIGATGKTLNYIGNKTIDFATHDTTKNVAIESAKIAGKVVSKTAKGAVYIASHDTTKNIAFGAAKISGKVLSKTAKGAIYVATHDKTKKKLIKGSIKKSFKLFGNLKDRVKRLGKNS